MLQLSQLFNSYNAPIDQSGRHDNAKVKPNQCVVDHANPPQGLFVS